MMQAFYWDCPREDKREFEWWNYVREQVATLAQLGFTSLWLPPAHKAANISGPSMGYDPYDYYDLGEFDQKGSAKTWFGSRRELLDLIHTAHHHGMSVIADMVINHNGGADAAEVNPITGQTRGRSSGPKAASSRAIGNASIPTHTRAGTRAPSATCPIFPIATLTSSARF